MPHTDFFKDKTWKAAVLARVPRVAAQAVAQRIAQTIHNENPAVVTAQGTAPVHVPARPSVR